MTSLKASLKKRIHNLRVDAHALWLLVRDPATPWFARLLGMIVAAYALSPIDLIPDFVPIIGLLDDLIIVPLGIWLILHLIPKGAFAEKRKIAEEASHRPISYMGAAIIITIWVVIIAELAFNIWAIGYW